MKTSFDDFDKAIDLVKQGKYWGVAAIPLSAFQTDPATLNASSLHLYLDMTIVPTEPILVENGICNVTFSYGLLFDSLKQPPHRSTTGSPL
ncbi:unnamed protein product [Rotaria sp. Silwood1]|nr:unnamed protein product [Rotaria sp. Silwood1]